MTTDGSRGGRLELVLAGATATVMIAHQVAAKAARDSLFLTWFDVSVLPMMMIAGALGSAAAVLVMVRVLARHGPARLIPAIYGGSGFLFLLEWIAMDARPQPVILFFYLHISVLGSILISGFWSIINERYDPYRAKLVIGRLAAAATLGGLLGGLTASAVASLADARSILLMLAGMHLFCGLSLRLVARGSQTQRGREASSMGQMFQPLRHNRLIRRMALLVAVVATTAALLDFLLKSTAAATLAEEELVHFFSSFYVAVGLGGFLLQTFVGNRALRWLGIGGTMAALPLVVLAGGLLAFFVRHLLSVAVLRGGVAVLNNSFFRAGFESLYTPIPAVDKRSSKLLIDVGADRMGDMAGSLLIMGILLFPRVSEDLLIVTAGLLGMLALLLVVALHRGYVAQLASNLRDGSLRAADVTAEDATTRHTLALTQSAVNRDQLLREIERSRRGGSPGAPGRADAGVSAVAAADPVVAAVLELRSGDDARISRALLAQSVTPELLPHVIPLLGREAVLRDVFRALRPVASSASGQLVDALLERRTHRIVRRRLPLVLGRSDTILAVHGLVACLSDSDADVCLRCGEALGRLRANNPQLAFPAGDLWEAAHSELRRLRAFPGDAPRGEDLRHLFHLLGVLYTPDTMDLCYRSLLSSDRGLRGTALEYLENLLPQEVREALWPVLQLEPERSSTKRPLPEIARDLLKARRTPRVADEDERLQTRPADTRDSGSTR